MMHLHERVIPIKSSLFSWFYYSCFKIPFLLDNNDYNEIGSVFFLCVCSFYFDKFPGCHT